MLFFITGVSAGLGRAAAEAALADGHIVVGTLRHADQITAFEALAPGRAYGRLLDVTDEGAIVRVVDGVESDIDDIEAARAFYGGLLGCPQGREDPGHWIDFNFRGHQLVVHRAARSAPPVRNEVDGDAVPVPHFGLVLDWDDWDALAMRLKEAGVEFVIEPHIRFVGRPGEQATMFFFDPAGNALEFKAFRDIGQLFAT